MKVLKTKTFDKAIILIKILEDGRLLVVDSATTVRYLDREELEIIDGFKGKIEHERYKTNVVAFSNNGHFFAAMSSDAKEAKLYNVTTKKAVAKANRHQGEVSCVGIDPNTRFMFSGGDDGKTFAIDITSGKLAFTLPVHVDTINDIAFSDNGQWIATASYDRKISLFNLPMMTPKEKLKAHAAPVMKLQFLKNHRLVSIDKNATVIIWDTYKSKIIARLQGVHDDVLQVTKSSDDKFLFLGTALGHVIVYETEHYKQLARSYIKLTSPITALAFDDENEHLIIGTEEGDIQFYDIYEGGAYLKTLIQKKQYDEVEKYVDLNPLLAYTNIYSIVDDIWEKTVQQAKIFLEKGQKENAIKIFTPFKNIPAKNKIMQKTIMEYDGFDKFVDLAKQGKLALAYSLANAHPMYKETRVYAALEKQWKKAFAVAQKYSLDPKGKEKAKEILAPYRGISEKTVHIQELFLQSDVYRRFKIAMGQKDFKITFELIKQHSFLRQFPEYESLMSYADNLYMQSQKFIADGDVHSAIKLLRILVDFTDFTEEVRELMHEIELREKFFDAMKEENITEAYNILDQFEGLQATEEGAMLQENWNKDLTKAEVAAVEGDAAGVQEAFEAYASINSKFMAMATIFGWCYMTQLEIAIKSKANRSVIENGIKNYILCFGVQDQILNFYRIFKKYYPDTKLNLELLTKGSLKMWRPSMIVNSILD